MLPVSLIRIISHEIYNWSESSCRLYRELLKRNVVIWYWSCKHLYTLLAQRAWISVYAVTSHWLRKGSFPLAKGLSQIELLQWAAFFCDRAICGQSTVLGMPSIRECFHPWTITGCLQNSNFEWPSGGTSSVAWFVSRFPKGRFFCTFFGGYFGTSVVGCAVGKWLS